MPKSETKRQDLGINELAINWTRIHYRIDYYKTMEPREGAGEKWNHRETE